MDKNCESNDQFNSPYVIKGTPRHASRFIALQMLYQIDIAGTAVETVFQQFIEEGNESGKANSTAGNKNRQLKHVNLKFVEQLINGVIKARQAINEHVKKHVLENFDRLPIILHEILELAIFEILYIETPPPVAINEYVEISKDFFNEEEQAFVNGVLDSIRKDLINAKESPTSSEKVD
ncbi:MAG: transcription antitermination factor NusB [Holosporales bacterium]|nr:transcription antitermination factor NusB [Holosporales bacterium]